MDFGYRQDHNGHTLKKKQKKKKKKQYNTTIILKFEIQPNKDRMEYRNIRI